MMTLTDKEFFALRDFVQQNYGIDLSKKRILIQGRLNGHLQQLGLTSFTEYIDLVMRDKSGVELQMLLNRLTTNLTYFLREQEHFQYLQQVALPELDRINRHRALRVWSAGCSSGEEAYTLAMTLLEHYEGRGDKVAILATDISQRVLEQAQRGVYTAERLKDVPKAWLAKYFNKLTDEDYQVKKEVRDLVTFRLANLMAPFRFSNPFEIIFCRNVMIYFDKPTKENLVCKFFTWTSPGGYFFVSHSENLSGSECGYRMLRPSMFRKDR